MRNETEFEKKNFTRMINKLVHNFTFSETKIQISANHVIITITPEKATIFDEKAVV